MPGLIPIRTCSRTLAISLAAVTLLALVPFADAQGIGRDSDRPGMRGQDRDRSVANRRGPMRGFQRPGTFANLLRPDFHIRDMNIITQELELDTSQRPIVEALLVDYRHAFTEAAREVQEALRQGPRYGFGPGMMAARGGNDDNGDAPATRTIELGGGRPMRLSIGEGDDQVEVRGRIAMTISTDSDGESSDDADSDADGGPSITVTDEDGNVITEELPEQVQERLERIHQRIEDRSRRMQERVERWREREAERKASGEMMDPSEVTAVAEAFRDRKDELHQRFTEDVDMLLSDWQQSQWPQVQQQLRRLNRMAYSQLSGEQVDLTHVIRDLHLRPSERRTLAPLLEEYHDDLDEALQQRQSFLDDADIEQYQAMHDDDWDALLSLADREAQRRVAVRSVNDEYADRFAEALPDEMTDRFNLAVFERSFPFLAMPTRASRLFEQALSLDSLEDEQRETIAEMQAEHDRELLAMNDAHRRALREQEPKRGRFMLEMFQQMREGDMDDDARERMAEAFRGMRERMNFGREYVQQMREIIPEEVLPELHEQRRRGWQGRMFGQSGDGEDTRGRRGRSREERRE